MTAATGNFQRLLSTCSGGAGDGFDLPAVQYRPAMAVTKTERVAGGDFGAAVSRPGRAALGPAPPLPGPGGVPVRLVGETTGPAADTGVLGRAGLDLLDDPGCDQERAHLHGGIGITAVELSPEMLFGGWDGGLWLG